jgi:carboxypeptidase D
VDQPPGTGFSTVPTNGYLHELDQVRLLGFCPRLYCCHESLNVLLCSQASAHLLQFMQNFYKVFPELEMLDVGLVMAAEMESS